MKKLAVNSPRLGGGFFGSKGSSPSPAPQPASPSSSTDYSDLSPELIPIVTLISSQVHRRYHEGIFMLYYDLNGDGKPADREWKEVYGILTGNQLAYWDAATLAQFRNNPDALIETSAKPNYINFTDSVYNAMKVLPAAKQNLDNVIIVSTTLKNRYLLQFKSYSDLTVWYSALRLSNYEHASLQKAYTGALLSARGSRLSDIRTILAEKRFEHEDWVSIRYGSGMAWKRCYAVVEPSVTKRKNFTPGRVLFYDNDQKKKKGLLAVVTSATMVTAIYPQSHKLIDHSTMLKLDAMINFKSPSVAAKVSKKQLEDFKNTSIFLMPEQHSSVPGFDTLIRFLIPLLDSFGLYGRPKRLKADRVDPDSLLFGLPTLPYVHYLQLDDVTGLTKQGDFLSWDATAWNNNIKRVMESKLARGYDGCGSSRGLAGAGGALSAMSSPHTPQGSFGHKSASPQKRPPPKAVGSQSSVPVSTPRQPPSVDSVSRNVQNLSIGTGGAGGGAGGIGGGAGGAGGMGAGAAGAVAAGAVGAGAAAAAYGGEDKFDPHKSVQLADIYAKYSSIKAPSDQFHQDRNQVLNGSSEDFDDDALPAAIRNASAHPTGNMYPAQDYAELESDDDSEPEVDSRQLGSYPNGSKSSGSVPDGSLQLPGMDKRNSSYSSVHSPMTQYNEFHEQFGKAVGPSNLGQTEFSGFSDDDDDAPPPPPKHGRTHEKVNSVSYGAAQVEDDRKLSVHSEQGKLSSGSSLYSHTSPQQHQVAQPMAGGPRISSPNISQNRPGPATAKSYTDRSPPKSGYAGYPGSGSQGQGNQPGSQAQGSQGPSQGSYPSQYPAQPQYPAQTASQAPSQPQYPNTYASSPQQPQYSPQPPQQQFQRPQAAQPSQPRLSPQQYQQMQQQQYQAPAQQYQAPAQQYQAPPPQQYQAPAQQYQAPQQYRQGPPPGQYAQGRPQQPQYQQPPPQQFQQRPVAPPQAYPAKKGGQRGVLPAHKMEQFPSAGPSAGPSRVPPQGYQQQQFAPNPLRANGQQPQQYQYQSQPPPSQQRYPAQQGYPADTRRYQ
ncbi:protein Skg3p [Diutina catenulata]